MNPVAIAIGPLTLHAYTAWLMGGMLAGLGLILLIGCRRDPDHVAAWLDVGIAGIVAGVIGARLMYVALEWDFFAENTGEITRLSHGGLDWHGGLLLAVPAVILAARLRRVPLRPWSDAAALAWPVGLAAAWLACRRNGCGYGYEVATLADWPGWLVAELPDVYGLIAPRLDVQAGGAVWGGLLLALALVMTWRGWLPGVRVWAVLAFTGLGLALLDFFRADPAPRLLDHRADLVFDLLVLLFGTTIGGMLWLLDVRAAEADSTARTSQEESV